MPWPAARQARTRHILTTTTTPPQEKYGKQPKYGRGIAGQGLKKIASYILPSHDVPSHRGVRAEESARATNLLAVLPNTCAVISPQAHHTVLPRRSLNNVPSHCCFRAEECARATNLLAVPPDTCAVISPQAHRTVLPTRSLNKQPPHCKPTMQQTTTSLQTYDAPSTNGHLTANLRCS